MSQILVELIKLANLIITLTKSIASGNRIQDMLEFGEEPDNTGKQDCKVAATAGAEIRFDHVSCRYPQASADAPCKSVKWRKISALRQRLGKPSESSAEQALEKQRL